ncbi:MAG: hypothetical protein LBS11_07470 [Oscillospiraceae bacterium]|jgi:hypothetical protein|nr:hypothetical protein [Oscillospiraceae bacterium]
MERFTKSGTHRYLLLLPIVTMILFTNMLVNLIEGLDAAILKEKVIEKRVDVDLVADQIDRMLERGHNWALYYNFFESCIISGIETIDSLYETYAGVYDENLISISTRVTEYDAPFNPNEYPEFVRAVHANMSGEFTAMYEPEGLPVRAMHLYFRWVPSDPRIQERFLLVSGASHLSVQTKESMRLVMGITALIIVTTLLNCAIVVLLGKMSNIIAEGRHVALAQGTGESADE